MPKIRMTEEEFDKLRPLIGRLSVDSVEIARQVLVFGKTQSEIAKIKNMSKQRVFGLVSRFLSVAQIIPQGWEKVEVWLPPEMAKQVREIEIKAKAELNQQN